MESKLFKFLPETPVNLLLQKTSRRNALLLLNLVGITILLIGLYALIFHIIAEYEGMRHNWFTGIYWTFEIMSTLGTGDIIFRSLPGQIFTVIVLLTGIGFILVVIPFVFLQMFQSTARIPREVARSFDNHVIITHMDEITALLIKMLTPYNQRFCILSEDMEQSQHLVDEGYKVIHSPLLAPATYQNANIAHAALVVLTAHDERNAALLHAIRLADTHTPVITTATHQHAGRLLKEAGADHVLIAEKILGETMARRVSGGDALAHLVGRMDNLLIAEATASGTPLAGKTVREANLRALTGLTVVGVWEKGRFQIARAETRITEQSALVLAGSREQIQQYNEIFCIYNSINKPVLIIGAGVVGRATAHFLDSRRIRYALLDIDERITRGNPSFHGDARDPETLKKLGLQEAPSVVITTHSDERNIYITTLARAINPDIQIIARATHDQATPLLHRAGADFVISYASTGATSIFNYLKSGNIMMITEGVDVFRIKTPEALHGRTLAQTTLRKDYGLSVIGIEDNGKIEINPPADTRLHKDKEIILIGTVESEHLFLNTFYKDGGKPKSLFKKMLH